MKLNKNIVFWIIIIVAIVVVGSFLFLSKKGKTDKIRMASLLPLDGQVAAYGEMMRNGQTLAMEEINLNKKVNEPILEILFFNTSHKKDVALDRLKEAVRNGIKFIAEIFGSDQAEHCLSYAIQSNIFILSGVDTKPDLIEKGQGNFYRIMPNDAAATEFLLQWANDLKIKKIAILYANDDWGEGLLNAAIKNCSKYNIELIEQRDISRNQPSFSAVVTQLKSSGADGIFLFIYPDDGGRFLKEAARQNLMSKYFATENFTGTDMIKSAKDAAEGVMLVVPATSPENPKLIEFKKTYKNRFGNDPTIFSIKGYDAVNVLHDIIILSDNEVAKAKEIIKNYSTEGLSGKLSFDENGEFIPGVYDRLVFVKIGDNYVTRPFLE
ncbi:MAG: amino acid ABC transporter substrate-binding protein [Ignavibacteriales bacterium]|nr:amino acid ABC transporter substrate-binding protein [Ignavibacteriales bacterium]